MRSAAAALPLSCLSIAAASAEETEVPKRGAYPPVTAVYEQQAGYDTRRTREAQERTQQRGRPQ
jgi:hypothetical protein